MMSYEDFDKYMTQLKKEVDFIEAFSMAIDSRLLYEKLNCISIVPELMEAIMDDTEGRISDFCWTLDFGRTYVPDAIRDKNDRRATYRTTKELYNYLVESKK